MTGFGSRRQLTSEAGAYGREARRLERQGYRGEAGKLRMMEAQSRLGESRIGSAESRMAEQEYSQRMQAGLAEVGRRSLLGQGMVGIGQPVMPEIRRVGDLPGARKVVGAAGVEGATGTQGATGVKGATGTQGATRSSAPLTTGVPQVPGAPLTQVQSTSAPAAGATTPAGGTKPTSLLSRPQTQPTSMIDGRPAREVLSGASVGLSKEDILRKAREESAGNPSVTRQDVIDRMNAERRAKGFTDVEITGKELAAADTDQQTTAAANRSVEGQKFDRMMSGIQSTLNPPKPTVPRLLERPAETNVPTLLRRESAAPTAPANPTTQSRYGSPAQMYGDLSRAAGPPQPILDQYGRKPKRMPVLSSAADLAEYDRVMAQGTITGQDIRNAGSAVKRGVQSSVRYLEELPNRTNAWSNRVSEKLRRDLGIQ